MEAITDEVLSLFPESEVKKDDELLSLADKLVETRKERERLESKAKDCKQEEEQLIETLSTQMIAKGLKSIDREDGIKLTTVLTPAFYIKSDKKQDFLVALKEHGDGGLIKEDVPYQTLNAFFKSLEGQIKDKDVSEETRLQAVHTYANYAELIEKFERRGIQIRGLKNKI